MVLRSDQFDDVYFSAEDGLAETRHVFLAGNDLPQAWADRADFTILEMGFGTGLNILVAAQEFAHTAKPSQHLHLISVEKYPLAVPDIRAALMRWADVLQPFLDVMLMQYPLRVGGWYRINLAANIHLTLIFDDVHCALPELDACVDAFFLDGFAPAKNPEMWTPQILDQLGRLAAKGARFATFTAARAVRDGLAQAGFSVEKTKGFGRKRDMLRGVFAGLGRATTIARKSQSIGIIGGGLAGAAVAYVFQKAGHDVTVYEAQSAPAQAASGNPVGLYNPRFAAQRSPEAVFYMSAFAAVYHRFTQFEDVGFAPTGAVHLATDAEKKKRFQALVQNWGWHKDHACYEDAQSTSARLGYNVPYQSLWLPDSGAVSPNRVVQAYLRNIKIHTSTAVQIPQALERHDVVIKADAQLIEGLPMTTVRGQVTFAQMVDDMPGLSVQLCYGGYCSAPQDGRCVVGSTFQSWLTSTDTRAEDDAQNLSRLATVLPEYASRMRVTGARAALRVSTQDRFPIVGQLQDRVYVSAAHGSHGLLSSLMAARVIADDLAGVTWALPRSSLRALAPARFAERSARKIR